MILSSFNPMYIIVVNTAHIKALYDNSFFPFSFAKNAITADIAALIFTMNKIISIQFNLQNLGGFKCLQR